LTLASAVVNCQFIFANWLFLLFCHASTSVSGSYFVKLVINGVVVDNKTVIKK
jgi:hypothetical protein